MPFVRFELPGARALNNKRTRRQQGPIMLEVPGNDEKEAVWTDISHSLSVALDSVNRAAPRPLRILVLPGYLQNKSIISAKLQPIRELIGSACEFVIIEPPHIQLAPTVAEADTTADHILPSSDAEGLARAWWFACEKREKSTHCRLLNETIQYLRNVLETEGPFDAVFGFSQGAACATVLTSLLANPQAHPVFAKPAENWPPKQFKFAILVSGFLPKDKSIAHLFEQQLDVPSLHVLGHGDAVISNESSHELASVYNSPHIEFHYGGHYIPNKPSWVIFFGQYLDACAKGAHVAAPLVAQRPGGMSLMARPTSRTRRPGRERVWPISIPSTPELACATF